MTRESYKDIAATMLGTSLFCGVAYEDPCFVDCVLMMAEEEDAYTKEEVESVLRQEMEERLLLVLYRRLGDRYASSLFPKKVGCKAA